MGRPPTINRERLIDTARRVFAAKGFAATTLADIAGELKVTPAAILRHVDSKQALFGLAMQSGMLLDPPNCILELPLIDAKTDPRVVLRPVRWATGFDYRFTWTGAVSLALLPCTDAEAGRRRSGGARTRARRPFRASAVPCRR